MRDFTDRIGARLTRRRLLAAAGTATAMSVAGCNQNADEPGANRTDEPTDTGTEAGTETPGETPMPSVAAACSVSPGQVAVGELLTIDASGTTGATHVTVDIDGDGTTEFVDASDFIVTYRTQSAGTLTPTVTAHNGDESDTVECGSVTASEGGSPVAKCRVSKTDPTVGETVTIDASDSEHTTSIGIDLDGDGSVDVRDSTDFVVDYAFPKAGEYTPQVTAYGGETGEETDTHDCEPITVTEPAGPTANCSVSSTDVVVGETVTIDASDSEHAQTVQFDLNGDGTVDIVAEDDFVVDYTFPAPGEYTPQVTATNAAGEDSETCETITVGETSGQVIEVPPTKTYLRTNGDSAGETTPVALADIGVSPGDRITLTRLGHFTRGNAFGSAGFGMHGVFSSSATLLDSDKLHRVPDAIDAGPAMATSKTYYGGRPTNILEDFGIATNDRSVVSATVDVPAEATHLFVAARDNLYEDNSDDPRYAVRIEHTPDTSVSEDIDPDESVTEGSQQGSGGNGDPAAPNPDLTIPIDPAATYLHTNGDDAADAEPINLESIGVSPGDEVTLIREGSFDGGRGYGMHAVFSKTATLLAGEKRERVPGAVDAGRDHETSATYHGNEETDIPQDFLVADHGQTYRSVTVTVPRGANYLFVAAKDNLYEDNTSNGFSLGIAF